MLVTLKAVSLSDDVCLYICLYVCLSVYMDGWMDGWMDGCNIYSQYFQLYILKSN